MVDMICRRPRVSRAWCDYRATARSTILCVMSSEEIWEILRNSVPDDDEDNFHNDYIPASPPGDDEGASIEPKTLKGEDIKEEEREKIFLRLFEFGLVHFV